MNFYIRDKGIASVNGSLYTSEVQHPFLNYYPEQYLRLMQSEFNPGKPANWLRLFIRYNNKNRSPLRHLLFLQFLDIDLDEFFNMEGIVGKKEHCKAA
ncbi:hypothetical protein H9655_18610 [Cytobacillus sp. Sa5YUA1]|uniref:Transposon Tn7 transposition protein TnsD C-terminal domain-containing protein n=1 Tax=Cytobacillus stercorigallinarum TaxID=2762240 RepID=A0ABR8QU77_9BACI|nr:hypothetical protein [Cytobacillus stercorigallinarum]